jgi:hypothetical protein
MLQTSGLLNILDKKLQNMTIKIHDVENKFVHMESGILKFF